MCVSAVRVTCSTGSTSINPYCADQRRTVGPTGGIRQMMNLIKEEMVHSAQVTAMNIDSDQLLALYAEGQPNAAGLAWQGGRQ
jgi:hypothetical protein